MTEYFMLRFGSTNYFAVIHFLESTDMFKYCLPNRSGFMCLTSIFNHLNVI